MNVTDFFEMCYNYWVAILIGYFILNTFSVWLLDKERDKKQAKKEAEKQAKKEAAKQSSKIVVNY